MTKKNVVVLDPCSPENQAMLQKECGEFYNFTFYSEELNQSPSENKPDSTPNQQDISTSDLANVRGRLLSEAEVMIGEPDYEEIKDLSQLKWVQMTWAGTDKYTKNGPFPKHVLLTHAAGAFGVIISEYIMAGILSLYRNLPYYHDRQKEHIWSRVGHEETIYGKTALILGAGNIGSETAKRLQCFGCKTLGIRRKAAPSPYFDQVGTMEQLEEWLPKADLLICAMPNNKETIDFLDVEKLAGLKPTAIIVNVGRGHLFQEGTLETLLAEDKVAGMVLDVHRIEPLEATSLLWEDERVIITPHIAGPSFSNTRDTEDRIYAIAKENLLRYSRGEELRNQAER